MQRRGKRPVAAASVLVCGFDADAPATAVAVGLAAIQHSAAVAAVGTDFATTVVSERIEAVTSAEKTATVGVPPASAAAGTATAVADRPAPAVGEQLSRATAATTMRPAELRTAAKKVAAAETLHCVSPAMATAMTGAAAAVWTIEANIVSVATANGAVADAVAAAAATAPAAVVTAAAAASSMKKETAAAAGGLGVTILLLALVVLAAAPAVSHNLR